MNFVFLLFEMCKTITKTEKFMIDTITKQEYSIFEDINDSIDLLYLFQSHNHDFDAEYHIGILETKYNSRVRGLYLRFEIREAINFVKTINYLIKFYAVIIKNTFPLFHLNSNFAPNIENLTIQVELFGNKKLAKMCKKLLMSKKFLLSFLREQLNMSKILKKKIGTFMSNNKESELGFIIMKDRIKFLRAIKNAKILLKIANEIRSNVFFSHSVISLGMQYIFSTSCTLKFVEENNYLFEFMKIIKKNHVSKFEELKENINFIDIFQEIKVKL